MNAEKSTLIVSRWIFFGVLMLLIQVLLGGITRLTGSGLSITEWKPIMGFMPPLSETEWQQAFNKYKQIAQYKYLNNGFTITNFKFIFFWEWFHRLWARLIGFVFIIPFIYFIIKKYFKAWMIGPLIILFLLGALQGAIGWIMVKSGLNDDNLYVSHIKLAIHFISAMVLITYALIFGIMVRIPPEQRIADNKLKKFTIIILCLITIQLFYGALLAGLKAASAAPTWPDINGMIIPDVMFKNNLLHNFFINPITVHFIHRTTAYILFILIIIWWRFAVKHKNSVSFNKVKNLPIILVMLQLVLGILAVLNSTKIVLGYFGVFEWLAQLHQLVGMLLLLSLAACVYILNFKRINS